MNIIRDIVNSFNKNKKGIAMMLFSSVCVCVGQLLWKLASGETMNLQYLFAGFLFYGVGAVVMVLAYRYGSLSVLQPMLAFNYVFAIFLANFFLHEEISLRRIIGILVVIIGTLLIGGGDD